MAVTNILILTSDAGFGHRKAAEAISAALDHRYGDECQAILANPLTDPDLPGLIRQLETGYDDIVLDDPTLYQLAYTATDAPVVAQLMQDVTTSVLNQTLVKLVNQHQPHAIITTYPAYTQAAIRASQDTKRVVPVYVVVTDLIGVHSLWFHSGAAMTFVPTGNVYKQALDQGVAKDRVRITGLPVHPSIALEKRPPSEIRQALGWEPDVITGLIVGSTRSREMAGIAELLDRSGLGLQLAAVAGGNQEMEARLRAARWHGKVHIYGLVKNLPEMMHAADFIVCKAGGLIVTEALACGLPLLLHDALPGQEVGNVRYVTESGAGVWAPGPTGVLTSAFALLAKDATDLKKLRTAAKRIGKPNAAFEIADAVIRAARS